MESTLSKVHRIAAEFFHDTVQKVKMRLREAGQSLLHGDDEDPAEDRKLGLTRMGRTYRYEFRYMKRSSLHHMCRAAHGVNSLVTLARHYAKLKKPIPDEPWMRALCVDEEAEAAPEWMQRRLFLVAIILLEPSVLEWLSVEDKGSLSEWLV